MPDCAQILVFCKNKIQNAFEVIKSMVEMNDHLRINIPKLFIPLMRPQLLSMENVFMPGFSTITWTSMKIPEFCDEISGVLERVQVFVKDVSLLDQVIF